MMKLSRLLTLTVLVLLAAHASAQTTYPYNPDDNADGFIQVYDLQSFLQLYGQEFQPSAPDEPLQVTNLSNLPSGIAISNNVDVLDFPTGLNAWVYLPNPNSPSAHRVAVLHGGTATVRFVPQANAYKLEVNAGYENANNYNVSVLMPFMGKWLVGR